jgi:hypothetical protein
MPTTLATTGWWIDYNVPKMRTMASAGCGCRPMATGSLNFSNIVAISPVAGASDDIGLLARQSAFRTPLRVAQRRPEATQPRHGARKPLHLFRRPSLGPFPSLSLFPIRLQILSASICRTTIPAGVASHAVLRCLWRPLRPADNHHWPEWMLVNSSGSVERTDSNASEIVSNWRSIPSMG